MGDGSSTYNTQLNWFASLFSSKFAQNALRMKRNPNLVNLSSEHHDGLVIALRIKKAISKLDDLDLPCKQGLPFSNGRQGLVLAYALHAWPTLKHHFAQEEENFLSFPQIERSHPHVARMLDEHQQFEQIVNRLSLDSNELKKDLLAFSELLKNHIRFEERILFPYIEDVLSDEELLQIGEQLAETHQAFHVDWGESFWV